MTLHLSKIFSVVTLQRHFNDWQKPLVLHEFSMTAIFRLMNCILGTPRFAFNLIYFFGLGVILTYQSRNRLEAPSAALIMKRSLICRKEIIFGFSDHHIASRAAVA